MIDIKDLFEKHPIIYRRFKFEVFYNPNNSMRIWIGRNKTRYYNRGDFADAEPDLISSMVNDMIGSKIVAGTINELKDELNEKGSKLEIIYRGKQSTIYEIELPEEQ